MEKSKKKKLPYLEQFRHLREHLTVAGVSVDPKILFIALFGITTIIDLSLLFFIIYQIANYKGIEGYIALISLLMLTLGYALIFMIVWLLFLFILDFLKFRRKTQMEDVLPEFLRQVSANHRSGFSLEISLWRANRPRFGILSKEINEVARNTYAKGDLIVPLQRFAEKYDSTMLKRVVSNLVEGLRSGADISKLLDDISSNITTIKNTRKEMASEIENYMLFIIITVLFISPLMFALNYKMSGLIQNVKTTLEGSMAGVNTAGMNIPVNVEKSENKDEFKGLFDIFVYCMIATDSVVSVLLMSMVKYGNVKQDLKRIPVYYVIAITTYFVCKALFSNFLVISSG